MNQSSLVSLVFIRAGKSHLARFLLFVLLIVFSAACSAGTAESSTPAPADVEQIAAQPAGPTATAAEAQAQEPIATAAEPTLPVATEALPESDPTEVPEDTTAAPAAAAVQACDILTPEAAEAYLGEAPGPSESPVEGEGLYYVTSCSYTAADNQISLIITENVDKDPRVPASAFESDLPKSVENFGVEAVPVSGLGDMAAWISNPDWYVNNLDVVQGYYRIYLGTGGEKSDQPPPALVEVANMVLGKLP